MLEQKRRNEPRLTAAANGAENISPVMQADSEADPEFIKKRDERRRALREYLEGMREEPPKPLFMAPMRF